MSDPIWSPTPERIAGTELTRYMQVLREVQRADVQDMGSLWEWSVQEPEAFWRSVWEFCDVKGELGARGLTGEGMPGARWFPDGKLSFSENLLRRNDDTTAMIAWGENKARREISFRELRTQVGAVAQALANRGVGEGDRVAGLLPNVPAAVIAMLATASLGAVWASCSPDFGVPGVLDRFGQIAPKVLFSTDGYYYNGKVHMATEKLADIIAQLPTVETLVTIPYIAERMGLTGLPQEVMWEALLKEGEGAEPRTTQYPFDHPLYIMFSSGTTGAPKCIVHGAGGTLLQHVKEHRLHCDIKRDDRVFYFTTCGWMMWNWLVTALASEATIILYDGSPFWPRPPILWGLAQETGMTFFGTGAKYIDALRKTSVRPAITHKLPKLRTLASTGSPLVPESYDFIYEHIKRDIQVASISGGTDIVSCFVLGNPNGAVHRGELQCRGLGMAVDVFDDEGAPLVNTPGELVCKAPFPSMPIGFWEDDDGSRYRDAYFAQFPNIWCHGDWVELTERGGMIIFGRSDAVLNPGGVRIGTAEIYRQVELLDEVLESIVIGQPQADDVRVVLFVKLADGVAFDSGLADRIKRQIRSNTTPRHVPAVILPVDDIPRTKSGKITELAVRNVVTGRPVKNREALANPEALEFFRDLPELQ